MSSVARWDKPQVILRLKDGATQSVERYNAQIVMDAVQKIGLLAGITPKVFLTDGNNLNASAGYQNGEPVMKFNLELLKAIGTDRNAVAGIVGHELSHLYFHHGKARAQVTQTAELITAIAGLALEVFSQRKYHVQNFGIDAATFANNAYVSSYSRDNEREADHQGVEWAAKAGYGPEGIVTVFELLMKIQGAQGGFFSSHPSNPERIATARQLGGEIRQRNHSAYASASSVCG